MKKMTQNQSKQGFTLVEVMIVTGIIGMMAALAQPAVQKARTKSLQTRFINDVRVFADAAEYFTLSTGDYLEDSGSGAIPAGFETYITAGKWTDGTPIGGLWDAELDSFGIVSGFGVHFHNTTNPGDAFMRKIDAHYDDGNLTTGVFRKIDHDRYYYIIKG